MFDLQSPTFSWYANVDSQLKSCLECIEISILAGDFSLAWSVRDEFESIIHHATEKQKEQFKKLCRKITITTE